MWERANLRYTERLDRERQKERARKKEGRREKREREEKKTILTLNKIEGEREAQREGGKREK